MRRKRAEVENLQGQIFGRWTVIEFAGHRSITGKKLRPIWFCRCECGTEREVLAISLKQGTSKSCGCLKSELTRKRNPKLFSTHGHTKGGKASPTFISWNSMMDRCSNQKSVVWSQYGGAGITVCEQWHSFDAFLRDMGERPSKDYSLDRIDGEKGYFPGNVRWATRSEQNSNTTKNTWLTYKGETKTLSQWARHLNCQPETICNRLARGWSVEDALGRPISNRLRKNNRMLTVNGEIRPLSEWARITGLSKQTIFGRLKRGASPEAAIEIPLQVESQRKHRSHEITHDGQTHSIAGWERVTGIKRSTILKRLKKGWSVEEALTTKV